MTPTTQGAAASWFASMFGGMGQPTTSSTPVADSPQEWSAFSALLAGQMTTAPATMPAMDTLADGTTVLTTAATTNPLADEATDAATAEGFGVTTSMTASEGAVAGGDQRVFGPTWSDGAIAPDSSASDDPTLRDATPITTLGPANVDVGLDTTVDRTPLPKPTAEQVTTEASDAPSENEILVAATAASSSKPAATSEAQTLLDSVPTEGSIDPSVAAEVDSVPVSRTMAPETTATTATRATSAPHEMQTPAPTLDAPTPITNPTPPVSDSPTTTEPQRDTFRIPFVVPNDDAVYGPTVARTEAPRSANPAPAVEPTVASASGEVQDAMGRMRVTMSDERPARDRSLERQSSARDVGARLAVRPATAPPVQTMTTDAGAGDEIVAPAARESMNETLIDEFLEDEASHEGLTVDQATRATTPSAAAADDDGDGFQTRAAAPLPEAPTTTPAAATTEADPATLREANVTRTDLGARLRAAIIETLAAEAKDELLASTSKTWEAKVTVDPVSLGRVDVQVTQTTRGLEVILTATHQEAARALEAEMDDMAEELMRRDVEPARITVRSNDGDLDRNGRSNQDLANARAKQSEDEATAEREAEERQRGRGRDRQDLREREARG